MSTNPQHFGTSMLVPLVDNLIPEVSNMGRHKGSQNPKLQKTNAKRPQWWFRARMDVITGPGQTEYKEQPFYIGFCDEIGKREAEHIKREMLRKINNRPERIESQVPFSRVLDTYEREFLPTLKPNSRTQYACRLKHIRDRFGEWQIGQIKHQHVQLWLNELAAAKTRQTLLQVRNVLSSVFERAAVYGLLETRNPCDHIRLPEGNRVRESDLSALTPDQCRRLLAVTKDSEIGDAIRVAIFCGLRIGEILALTWASYKPPAIHVRANRSQWRGEVTRPKSENGTRAVPLGPVSLRRPADASANDRIFPMEYSTATRRLKEAAAAAGIEFPWFGFHTLRRTHATMMRRAGAAMLREQMGHASEEMSEHYVRESFDEHAAAALKMAELVMGAGGRPN